MKTLNEIMEKYGSDKGANNYGHNYCINYEKWFEPFRNEKFNLLELGVGGEEIELGGASLKGWKEYFPKASIFGIDIYDKAELNQDRLKVFNISQDNENALKNLIEKELHNDCKIIIDDASHFNELTIKSFKILFPLLNKGGIYVIEDLQCAYRWDFGGTTILDSMSQPTIMNYLFFMLHNLNPVQYGDPTFKIKEEFKEIESVHFYSDMVIIKKK